MPGEDSFVDFPFFGDGFMPMSAGSAGAASAATTSTNSYYTVQLAEPFTGFLQHLVIDRASGAVADMSAVCMM